MYVRGWPDSKISRTICAARLSTEWEFAGDAIEKPPNPGSSIRYASTSAKEAGSLNQMGLADPGFQF